MRWFGLSFAPFSKHIERFARQYRYSTKVSPDVALLKLSSPPVGLTKRKKQDTTHKHTYAHIFTYTHIHTHISCCGGFDIFRFLSGRFLGSCDYFAYFLTRAIILKSHKIVRVLTSNVVNG